jgi:pimeloyl-ACP methyl ester carboxylesterase
MRCTVRDVPIHYEDVGTGRPLLLLHGWPGDHRYMGYFLEPVSDQRPGWRRIYPDLPGFGQTPGADWMTSQDDMLALMLAFLDTVAPGERFVVAGASYGGYLARGMLHERAARMDGLMVWVPYMEPDAAKVHLPPRQVLARDLNIAAALVPGDELEELWAQVAVVQTAETLSVFRSSLKPAFLAADSAFGERIEQRFAFSFAVDELPVPFPAPTLVMTGRQDAICGYHNALGLLEHFPRGTFVVLDRAGHDLAAAQQTLFRALVGEWLDRVKEYAPDT